MYMVMVINEVHTEQSCIRHVLYRRAPIGIDLAIAVDVCAAVASIVKVSKRDVVRTGSIWHVKQVIKGRLPRMVLARRV